MCASCGTTGPGDSLTGGGTTHDTQEEAIAAWNKRHTPAPSNTQQAAAAVLAAQEAKGLSKYGTTLDTAGLSLLEIAEHYQQEAADALMYATAMVELMKKEAAS
ncbi:putative nucleic acid-binding protein [Armatimonas rosea]|uniref:Putative nucleic acid-binding protein n=2 Tax=Armatimonas rosea TaxID=685828 RepID=A0A7W9SUZ5_ARMRO|nr:putative nucleic acid-binding protein [Armatimonas rosea]